MERQTTPAEPPRAEESAREFRAKIAEPETAAQHAQPPSPAPLESGGAPALTQPAPKSLAAPPSGFRPGAATLGKEAQTSSLPSRSADELYSNALAESARQRYDRSIDEFRAFITQHPGDARVPDARLRLADAYVAQRRLAEAIREYETLIREFPGNPHLPTALLKLGQARLESGDQTGCQVLLDLTSRYPQAGAATLARETLSARCP